MNKAFELEARVQPPQRASSYHDEANDPRFIITEEPLVPFNSVAFNLETISGGIYLGQVTWDMHLAPAAVGCTAYIQKHGAYHLVELEPSWGLY